MFENLSRQSLTGAFGYNRNSMKTSNGNLQANINEYIKEP